MTNVDDLLIGEFHEMEVSQRSVDFIREIGHGEFGVVMEAVMHDANGSGLLCCAYAMMYRSLRLILLQEQCELQ